METCWLFDTLAVTVARLDFLDPAVSAERNARERGVRVEIRPLATTSQGSIYVSAEVRLQPAVCRIDLLESAPGAADRMHWHPQMHAGEPGDRVFESAMAADPIGWLTTRLSSLNDTLRMAAVPDVAAHDLAARQISEHAAEIGATAEQGLRWARMPWPDVQHDERGMALAD